MTPKEVMQVADVLLIHASKLCSEKHHQSPSVFGDALKAVYDMAIKLDSAMDLYNTLQRIELERTKIFAKKYGDYEQDDAKSIIGDFRA